MLIDVMPFAYFARRQLPGFSLLYVSRHFRLYIAAATPADAAAARLAAFFFSFFSRR